ncbi:hypothetical protein [Pseudomonas sp. MPR-R5A]|uniref:hypothetical protein n=1 Tax=Pseudomonas sp. MPR-R5A TaxID=2070626 RepID=UPI000C88AEA7|nr:hypothetical protein C1Y25_24020 [Pseudomonas sp. MPBC4-3]PMX44688.1 hypothetical protein C1Y20_24280 [Pseudomonas sp. FW301-21B01]PMY02225.1 hypothetical protein C1Y18_31290 [Pseudomonas sp. MPR-R5A]PNA65235.1 hypothetical protein C1Y14_24440 [Pseudomonas sp. MPR-R5B]
MDITSVHFICAVPHKQNENSREPYRVTHELCEFKLGLGPCGRIVTKLTITQDSHLMAITQVSIPGKTFEEALKTMDPPLEIKVFTYKQTDILGRTNATLLLP